MLRFRQIHTKIWKDGWFADLPPSAKLFYIYLFSNERAAIAGIYELPKRYMVFETGLTEQEIDEALVLFARAEKAWYEDGVVLIPNLRKYHETSSQHVQRNIATDLSTIPECPLKARYRQLFGGGTVAEGGGLIVAENGDEPGLRGGYQSPAMLAIQQEAKEWAKLTPLSNGLTDDERAQLRDAIFAAVNKGRVGTAVYTYDGGKKETELLRVVAYCNIRQAKPQMITRCFLDPDGWWYTESFGRDGNPPYPKNLINELDRAAEWYDSIYTVLR